MVGRMRGAHVSKPGPKPAVVMVTMARTEDDPITARCALNWSQSTLSSPRPLLSRSVRTSSCSWSS